MTLCISSEPVDPVSYLWQLAETTGVLKSRGSERIIAAFDVGFNVHFHPDERKFRQKLIFIVIEQIGCAFFDDWPIGNVSEFVGADRQNWRALPPPVQVAILNSLFFGYKWTAQAITTDHLICGLPQRKGVERTKLICDEVERVRGDQNCNGRRGRVGLVGVSRLQAMILAERGFEISAWDLDPAYIGQEILPGVQVHKPVSLQAELAQVDVLLVSGMTIANGSLLPLLLEAREQGKKVVLWAVTGPNIAPVFHEWGLDVAICEHFPQYFFPGDTKITISRAIF